MFVDRSILLLDDQSSAREELREILRLAQCAVVGEARNTDDALEKFERLQPGAVIIDVSLPGTIDPLVAIRDMRRSQSGVVIFATGTSSQTARMMEALTMGAADFIFKPFQQRSVHTSLQQNLG